MAFKLELQQHVNELNILMSGTFEFLSIDVRDKSSDQTSGARHGHSQLIENL